MKKQILVYPIILHPEDESGYSVEIPDINGGSWTQGETIEEAITMAGDLIGTMLMDADKFPQPTPLKDIKAGADDIRTVASVDINEYRKLNSKTVRKNVSVPEYLVKIGQEQGTNFSEVLTKALEEKLTQ